MNMIIGIHLALIVRVAPLPAVVVPLVLEDGEDEGGQLGHHLYHDNEDKERG